MGRLRNAGTVELIGLEDIDIGFNLSPGHCAEQEFGIEYMEERLGTLGNPFILAKKRDMNIKDFSYFGLDRHIVSNKNSILFRKKGNYSFMFGGISSDSYYLSKTAKQICIDLETRVPTKDFVSAGWGNSGFIIVIHKDNVEAITLLKLLEKSFLNNSLAVYSNTPNEPFSRPDLNVVCLDLISEDIIQESRDIEKNMLKYFLEDLKKGIIKN